MNSYVTCVHLSRADSFVPCLADAPVVQHRTPVPEIRIYGKWVHIKGIVQRKLRWVKIGIHRQLLY